MKFDLVITNPPYQDSSHAEKKNTLWRKFVELCVDSLVKENGHVSLVIPSSWMGSRRLLNKYFLPYNLKVINKDECKRHFSVGSTFSYFIMQKAPYSGKTYIINKQISGAISKGQYDIKNIVHESFPRDISIVSTSIVKKVLDPKLPSLGIINNTTHHCVHKDRWRLQKEGEFEYPVQNTPTKLYWYNSPHKHQDRQKIIIPTTTYFRRCMLTRHGTTQSFCYYLIPESVRPEVALHNINNIVFDYINECFRYANWNNVQILKKLPAIPMDRKLTKAEIYQHFKLNKKEIKLIENSITWRQQ